VGFSVTDQLLIRFLCIHQILEENWGTMRQYISYSLDFKKAYDSVRKEVLYSIFIEIGVPMKLVKLNKMCLYETYSKVHIGKHLSDNFPTQNDLKQGDALLARLFKFALDYPVRIVQE
jgi:hypothetical protein